MSCGLARFNDGPGSAVMKEEDLWGDITNFMWSKIIMFIHKTWYIDIRDAPRSGSFDMPSSNPLCFSTQPGMG